MYKTTGPRRPLTKFIITSKLLVYACFIVRVLETRAIGTVGAICAVVAIYTIAAVFTVITSGTVVAAATIIAVGAISTPRAVFAIRAVLAILATCTVGIVTVTLVFVAGYAKR